MSKVNSHALNAFNKNATLYDRYRPSYVSEAVDTLLDRTGVSEKMSNPDNDLHVIDLGAGTGVRV